MASPFFLPKLGKSLRRPVAMASSAGTTYGRVASGERPGDAGAPLFDGGAADATPRLKRSAAPALAGGRLGTRPSATPLVIGHGPISSRRLSVCFVSFLIYGTSLLKSNEWLVGVCFLTFLDENTVLYLLQHINYYVRVVIVVWYSTRRYIFLKT
jgi:hypothetical protein